MYLFENQIAMIAELIVFIESDALRRYADDFRMRTGGVFYHKKDRSLTISFAATHVMRSCL